MLCAVPSTPVRPRATTPGEKERSPSLPSPQLKPARSATKKHPNEVPVTPKRIACQNKITIGIRLSANPALRSSPGMAATRPTTTNKTAKNTQPAKSLRFSRIKKSLSKFTVNGANAITPRARPIHRVANPELNGMFIDRNCSTNAPTTVTPAAIGTIINSRTIAAPPKIGRERSNAQAMPASTHKAALSGTPAKTPPKSGASPAIIAPGRKPRHARPMTNPGIGSHKRPSGPASSGPLNIHPNHPNTPPAPNRRTNPSPPRSIR